MALKLPVAYLQKTYQEVSKSLLHPVAPSEAGSEGGRRRAWYETRGFERTMTVLSAVEFALFVPLAVWAHKNPQDGDDIKITHDMQEDASAFLINAARIISSLGSPKFLRVAVVPLSLLFWKKGLRLTALMTLSLNWFSELAEMIMKKLVNRPRPSPLLVQIWKKRHHASFPSGNVIATSTFWGWLFFLGLVHWRDKPVWQKPLLAIPVLFGLLVGPSRVYLGDHWASDVIGGYLFGNGWLGLWIRLYLLLLHRGATDLDK